MDGPALVNRAIVLPFGALYALGLQIKMKDLNENAPIRPFPCSSETIGDKVFNALHIMSLAKELDTGTPRTRFSCCEILY